MSVRRLSPSDETLAELQSTDDCLMGVTERRAKVGRVVARRPTIAYRSSALHNHQHCLRSPRERNKPVYGRSTPFWGPSPCRFLRELRRRPRPGDLLGNSGRRALDQRRGRPRASRASRHSRLGPRPHRVGHARRDLRALVREHAVQARRGARRSSPLHSRPPRRRGSDLPRRAYRLLDREPRPRETGRDRPSARHPPRCGARR